MGGGWGSCKDISLRLLISGVPISFPKPALPLSSEQSSLPVPLDKGDVGSGNEMGGVQERWVTGSAHA